MSEHTAELMVISRVVNIAVLQLLH